MPKIKFLNLIFTVLICCSPKMQAQNTIIFGKANNAKYGAVVVSSGGEVYYIDKMECWPLDFLNKSIKVTGKVFIKKIKKTDAFSGNITAPEIKIIRNPKFEILNEGQ